METRPGQSRIKGRWDPIVIHQGKPAEGLPVGVTGEGETLGSTQQWHAKKPNQARPSRAQHRRHAGTAAREFDDDSND
ncbi:hypothetical protein E2562_003117 [Oryza meyeriana var. granulata]|uniref:Uncharacterized protein n=1 Tax=Oryza meyeriana var. granulata TaxID=110450 RepID=A0A6G1E9R2_9ORYZ|nr:hypothetical protein E2562_003117 [Oryza meyeriana var. granulata]